MPLPVFVFTVAGASKPVQLGSTSIREVANGINVAMFEVFSASGAYRPDPNVEVSMTRNGVTVFGGYIDKVVESGKGIADIINRLECSDFNALADRRIVTETIPAGTTLRDAVDTYVMPYLTDYGVTRAAGMAVGPTLTAEIVLDGVLTSEALNRLAKETGYIRDIDYTKVLTFTEVGTVASPFSPSSSDGLTVGDVSVERKKNKHVNRVTVKAGPTAVITLTVPLPNGDGVEDTYPIHMSIAGWLPYGTGDGAVGYGVVSYDGGTESLGGLLAPVDVLWEYDPLALTVHRRSGPAPSGVVQSLTADFQFPILATAEDAADILANKLTERIFLEPTVTSYDEAYALAVSYLATFLGVLETVKFTTQGQGLHPGQITTLTFPQRAIAGDYLVTETESFTPGTLTELWTRATAIDAARFRGSFRDVYVAWLTQGGGGPALGTGLTLGGGARPGSPLRSVQFNDNGAFGGDPEFLYYKDENSLVCGDQCSITAFDFESCQVFGSNNSISDH